MTSVAEDLARAVTSAHRQPLPPESQAAGKRLLLNAAVLAPVGYRHPAMRTLANVWPPRREYAHLRPPPSPLSVARRAALAMNVDGYDDAHVKTFVHPACVNLAAAVAIGSVRPVSGAHLLSAFVLGCELEARCATALLPEAHERGWDLNGVCGTLSAAATSALLIDPSAARVANALEIAASSTVGLLGSAGSLLEPYTAGKAAENGVAAALLARARLTAPRECFESPRGLCQALIQRQDAFQHLASDFAPPAELAKTLVKRYPCSIVLHPFVDAVRELRTGGGRLSSITAFCSPGIFRIIDRPRPATGLEAKMSAQYCLATALDEGDLQLDHFADIRVANYRPRDGRISLVEDAAIRSGEAVVEAVPAGGAGGKHGTLHSKCVLRDATAAELTEKVTNLLAAAELRAGALPRYLDQLASIDQLKQADALVRLVTTPVAVHA